RRYDRVTGEARDVLEELELSDGRRLPAGIVIDGAIDLAGRVLALRVLAAATGDWQQTVPVLELFYDADGKRLAAIADPMALLVTDHGFVVAERDNRVVRITESPAHPVQELARLDAPIHAIGLRGDVLVVSLAGQLVRIQLATGATTRVSIAGTALAIAPDAGGIVWAIVDGVVSRWDGRGTPTAIAGIGALDELAMTASGMVAYGRNALVALWHDPPRVIGLASTAFSAAADSPWVAVRERVQIKLIDPVTGLTIRRETSAVA